MTLTDEQIKQRDAAYEEWVSARSPTLRTRHNEVIHNHGFEAGYKAALSAQPTQITAEMVREVMAHRPFGCPNPNEWVANALNEAIVNPGKLCPCCNVTNIGEVMDHLPLKPASPEDQAVYQAIADNYHGKPATTDEDECPDCGKEKGTLCEQGRCMK